MNDLVYVMFNRKLKERKSKKNIDYTIEDVSSDDEWITKKEDDTVRGKDEEGGGEDKVIEVQDVENLTPHASVDDLEIYDDIELENSGDPMDNSDSGEYGDDLVDIEITVTDDIRLQS